ncbi:MAG TPA: carboxypeptidase regulatory-like domain-containing protein [Methanocorpusculum sp.]|nr:carboxypeptidase regulatory-like domain-containing protein [Methanocorpusculum sp.]
MIKRIIVGILLVAVLFCGIAAADEFGTLQVIVVDTTDNHNPVSNAIVEITMDGGSYTNQKVTSLNGDGSVEFQTIPVGIYGVKVSKDGYITNLKSISVNPQPLVTPLNIQLAQDNPIMITVTDALTGQPLQNAEVKVNNAEPITTDAYGRAYAIMARGTSNSILVTANSYLPYSETKYIAAEDTAINIPMTIAEVSPLLLVYNEAKSPVSGAAVTVDGKLIAYTDSYGRAQLPTYTAGVTYPVSISCNGYNNYNQDIEFTTDKTDYIITLTYASTPVRVTVRTEDKVLPNALVYFDGANKGVTGTDGTFTATAEPGKTILISASLEGYNGESVTCTVQANTQNEVTILMKENFPTTLVGLGALAAIIVLLIVILLVVGKSRKNKAKNSPGNPSHGPTRKRDSL